MADMLADRGEPQLGSPGDTLPAAVRRLPRPPLAPSRSASPALQQHRLRRACRPDARRQARACRSRPRQSASALSWRRRLPRGGRSVLLDQLRAPAPKVATAAVDLDHAATDFLVRLLRWRGHGEARAPQPTSHGNASIGALNAARLVGGRVPWGGAMSLLA